MWNFTGPLLIQCISENRQFCLSVFPVKKKKGWLIFPKYFTFWKTQKDEVEADFQDKPMGLLIQREKSFSIGHLLSTSSGAHRIWVERHGVSPTSPCSPRGSSATCMLAQRASDELEQLMGGTHDGDRDGGRALLPDSLTSKLSITTAHCSPTS